MNIYFYINATHRRLYTFIRFFLGGNFSVIQVVCYLSKTSSSIAFQLSVFHIKQLHVYVIVQFIFITVKNFAEHHKHFIYQMQQFFLNNIPSKLKFIWPL